MISDKQKRIIQLAIIFISTILGYIFLSPLFENNTKASGLLGSIIGLLVSVAIFPETLKGIFEQPTEKRIERVKEAQSLGFERSWTYPTRMPFLLAIGLFILFVIIMLVISRFADFQLTEIQFALIFTPILFLLGLSGFLTLRHNEYIDNNGRRYRGVWAVLNGSILLLMGWGSLIALWVIIIFDIK